MELMFESLSTYLEGIKKILPLPQKLERISKEICQVSWFKVYTMLYNIIENVAIFVYSTRLTIFSSKCYTEKDNSTRKFFGYLCVR